MRHLLFGTALSLMCGCAVMSGRITGSSTEMAQFEAQPRVGFYRMLFDDFRSLNTDALSRSAVPWKVVAASLINYHRAHTDPQLALTEAAFVQLLVHRFGFVLPTTVENWPAGVPQPSFKRPVGIVSGSIEAAVPRFELETFNNGCATCHSGRLYDDEGYPDQRVWLGLPSTSVNFERYSDEVFRSLRESVSKPEQLVLAIQTIFPETSEKELRTIERRYLPALKKRILELDKTIGRFTPYSNGGPGLTNGVGTIQLYLGLIDPTTPQPEQVAFTSVPDFGGLRLRTSLLFDGVYSPEGWAHRSTFPTNLSPEAHVNAMAGVLTLVTVGTLGVDPDTAVKNKPQMIQVVNEIFTHYVSPPFPGPINAALAERGRQLYEADCRQCHGSFKEVEGRYLPSTFPNRLVVQNRINTDPVRAAAVKENITSVFESTALGRFIDAKPRGGYIAPALTGLWATAPYLHNGSVPTLWQLLKPADRPARFEVGGHRLDYQTVGLAGSVDEDGVYRDRSDYKPWSLPSLYDTTLPGRGNEGHALAFSRLTDAERWQLIEFLKLL